MLPLYVYILLILPLLVSLLLTVLYNRGKLYFPTLNATFQPKKINIWGLDNNHVRLQLKGVATEASAQKLILTPNRRRSKSVLKLCLFKKNKKMLKLCLLGSFKTSGCILIPCVSDPFVLWHKVRRSVPKMPADLTTPKNVSHSCVLKLHIRRTSVFSCLAVGTGRSTRFCSVLLAKKYKEP